MGWSSGSLVDVAEEIGEAGLLTGRDWFAERVQGGLQCRALLLLCLMVLRHQRLIIALTGYGV